MTDSTKQQTFNRVTVVETLTYTTASIPPIVLDTRFSMKIDDEVDPLMKTIKFDKDWKKIEYHWIKKVRMVVIKNVSGEEQFTIPSALELEERKKFNTLEIKLSRTKPNNEHVDLVLKDNESVRLCPADGVEIWVRSTGKPTKAVVLTISE